jgi:hypothetical protein
MKKESFTFVLIMRTVKNILYISLITGIFLVSMNTYASVIVTGTITKKKATETFSLKKLTFSSLRTATFATLKSSLQYKGLAGANLNSLSSGTNSYMLYNKGNISYVIPYHHNVLTSKFKTPSAQ